MERLVAMLSTKILCRPGNVIAADFVLSRIGEVTGVYIKVVSKIVTTDMRIDTGDVDYHAKNRADCVVAIRVLYRYL